MAEVKLVETTIMDRLIEKLPFFDGSGRRRFVSGGLLVVAVLIMGWQETIKPEIPEVGLKEIIASPIIAAGLVLLVYAIGTVVEMIGEIFMVRAASGLFWGMTFPKRYWESKLERSGKFFANHPHLNNKFCHYLYILIF